MTELLDRVQSVADLAGCLDHQERFSAEYQRLLSELRQALQAMRGVAVLQIAYLRAQFGERARMN